jgi:hypothetical protein
LRTSYIQYVNPNGNKVRTQKSLKTLIHQTMLPNLSANRNINLNNFDEVTGTASFFISCYKINNNNSEKKTLRYNPNNLWIVKNIKISMFPEKSRAGIRFLCRNVHYAAKLSIFQRFQVEIVICFAQAPSKNLAKWLIMCFSRLKNIKSSLLKAALHYS